MTKSRPVLITQAILAGLQVITAGSLLADIVGEQHVGLIVLAIAAIQTGMAFYNQSKVTPNGDVAAYVDGENSMVAGPAAGVDNGARVEVLPAPAQGPA